MRYLHAPCKQDKANKRGKPEHLACDARNGASELLLLDTIYCSLHTLFLTTLNGMHMCLIMNNLVRKERRYYP